MEKNLSVLAIPVDDHRVANPYNYLLNAALKDQGITVRGYKLKRLLQANRFDLVHLHNPERFQSGKTAFARYRNFFFFWLKMVWLKLRGKKLVWTVHQLFPFKPTSPALTKHFYNLLLRFTDGFIALTKHDAGELAKLGVPAEKIAVIPYPHCRGHYPNSIGKKAAREKLGIPSDKCVFLFAGHIRNYENLVGLIKAFHQMADKNSVLVIAGKIHFDVSNELEAWIQSDENILVFPQFIEDEDLQFFFNSADMVVMPDRTTRGLGRALLNLSFGKPVLLSKSENILELQQQVGKRWIKTFSGHLSSHHLIKCKEEVQEHSAKLNPNLSLFEQSRIAKATRAFYEALLQGKPSPGTSIDKKEERSVAVQVSKNKALASLLVNSNSN